MEQGVSFAAPHTVHIDHDVTIGANTNIGAGVHLTKGAKIGTGCSIGAFSHIEQSVIADYVTDQISYHCYAKCHRNAQ